MKHDSGPKPAEQQETRPQSVPAIKEIPFGPYQFQPPLLFAGYRMGDVPTAGLRSFPWNVTETEALLINAYDFTRPKYAAVIQNGWNPTRDLDFGGRPILIDSGAYYFVKDNKIDIDPADVLKIERRSQAHVGVVLDHPFQPEAKDKSRRITRTLNNTRLMFQANEKVAAGFELMPVLHGHTRKSLLACLQKVRQLCRKYCKGEVTRVGIGSVAPLAQRGDARRATEIIASARELLPEAHIHCFSMGSPLLMLLAIYAGADTVDSQTWIVSAAFKYAQVPGGYAIRLARRDYATYRQFREAIRVFGKKLLDLNGREHFRAKDWKTGECVSLDTLTNCEDYAHALTDLKSNEHIHNRACHNLWVYNYEIRRFRQAIQDRAVEQFLESRMTGTRYQDTFRALKQRRGNWR